MIIFKVSILSSVGLISMEFVDLSHVYDVVGEIIVFVYEVRIPFNISINWYGFVAV
jgi:hypothetical protein